ncbi:MAG: DUF4238 domain-containing protein [Eubacterium sp.]|nr:DUF4238 domain-containing protein [Eubacterium sp.]
MRTKKQHYISQGILKEFAENKKIVELYLDKKKIVKKSIRNVMCQNNVFEHPFLSDNKIEKAFAELESSSILLIRKLIKDINNGYLNYSSIDNYIEDIQKLIPYALIFYFRSGALLQEYSFDSLRPKNVKVERMLKNIRDNNYINDLTKTIINCYECSILVDEKERLFISDQYLSTASLSCKHKFTNYSCRQIGLIDTMILLPLSSKIYIVFYNGNKPQFLKKREIITLNNEEVERINRVIIENAYHFCCGEKEEEFNKYLDNIDGAILPGKTIATQENGVIRGYNTKKQVFFYEIDNEVFTYFEKYVSDYQTKIQGKIRRNNMCYCGSGKQYKKCCKEKMERTMQVFEELQEMKNYTIPSANVVERPILDYTGYEDSLPKGMMRVAQKLFKEDRR